MAREAQRGRPGNAGQGRDGFWKKIWNSFNVIVDKVGACISQDLTQQD